MALCAFLLTLAFSEVANAASEGMQTVYHIEYGGLEIDIRAPVQVYPGEEINVTVRTEAVTEVYVDYIYVDLYGVINATDEVTFGNIVHLKNSSLTLYESNYNLTIPENISPGLTYGNINCAWEFQSSPQRIPSSGFPLTYIKDVELEQLQAEYDELNATHQSLVQNYTELKSDSNEADSTRSLMYVFIATTVVAVITVIILLIRKPKKIWV